MSRVPNAFIQLAGADVAAVVLWKCDKTTSPNAGAVRNGKGNGKEEDVVRHRDYLVVLGEVYGDGAGAVALAVFVDANERIGFVEERILEGDDDALQAIVACSGSAAVAEGAAYVHLTPEHLPNVASHLGDVGLVEGGVDFVEYEKRRGMEAMNGKEQGKGGDGLLSPGELLHISEALHWRHGTVLDATHERFLHNIHHALGRTAALYCSLTSGFSRLRNAVPPSGKSWLCVSSL